MINKKSNNTKLIMETWRTFISEGAYETEVETVNKDVSRGDWIIRAMTNAGEEYVVKQDKFPKLYDTKPVGEGPEGFMVYNVKPDVRTGIVIDISLESQLMSQFAGETVSQQEMHSWMQNNAKPVKVQKHKQAYAKQAQGGETIETKVAKAGGEILLFEAPWGGTMPVKSNDVLIINDKEIYRIARAEFDQTYEFV
jgi:hypothetical protein